MFKEAQFLNETFAASDLCRMDFSHAEFNNCDFIDFNLERSDFLGAQFTNCDFLRCNLSSFFTGVEFKSCTFQECDFDEAYIFRTNFESCDITRCSMVKTLLATVQFPNTHFCDVRITEHLAISSPPIIIEGLEYPITVYDNGFMEFGCALNTQEWFCETATARDIAELEGLRAVKFWKKHKPWIVEMIKSV
jgi:hypothetical protein